MDRVALLRSLCDTRGLGLEIGPSYNPVVPKSAGYNIEIVDYTDQASLRKKYQDTQNVDIEKIEVVDYPTHGVPLTDAIPHRRRYDYIIASHVVEHTPDFIGFLIGCEALLKVGGILVLAVPDKRFCFDMLQPLSTTGSMLQAHLEKCQRPKPGHVFDSVAYDVLRDGQIGWPADCAKSVAFNSDLATAKRIWDILVSSSEYIDVHVWRFVPSSFRLIVEDLYMMGAIPVREARFISGGGHEFFVTLSTSGKGPGSARIDLGMEAMRELAAVNLQS